jgi:hypothetical protein
MKRESDRNRVRNLVKIYVLGERATEKLFLEEGIITLPESPTFLLFLLVRIAKALERKTSAVRFSYFKR